jgi:DNA-binding response OmpR family regulator
MNHILIIEDDTALSNGIVLALKDDHCTFIQAHDMASAKKQLKNNFFDLVILDINLPDGNGLDLLADVRKILVLGL